MPRRNNTPKHQPYIDKNTCKSKRRFISEIEASQAANLLELHNNENYSYYKCERCGGWHLTRKSKAND